MTDLTVWETAPFNATIDHILQRYHETHRRQLAEILPLAEKVTRVHADTFSQDVLPLLQHMAQELDSHMMKEERVLFPMIKQGVTQGAAMPIRMMMMEHDDHSGAITQLLSLTVNLETPAHACGSWQNLYAQLREFVEDLQNHIELENTILFRRVLA